MSDSSDSSVEIKPKIKKQLNEKRLEALERARIASLASRKSKAAQKNKIKEDTKAIKELEITQKRIELEKKKKAISKDLKKKKILESSESEEEEEDEPVKQIIKKKKKVKQPRIVYQYDEDSSDSSREIVIKQTKNKNKKKVALKEETGIITPEDNNYSQADLDAYRYEQYLNEQAQIQRSNAIRQLFPHY